MSKIEKKDEKLMVDSELLKDIAEQEEIPMKFDPADKTAVVKLLEEKDAETNTFSPENFDDEFESNGLLTGQQYDVPGDADAFVNTQDGEVIKKEDMTPWEIIKSIAQQNGVDIREPASNCKFCYERGYEGIDAETKMPVPCRCIFRGRSEKDKDSESYYDGNKLNQKISRQQKRRMAKFLKSAFRRDKRNNLRRAKAGLPILEKTEGEEEVAGPSNREINKVLKEYIKKDSLKKTAISLKMTLTNVKNIVKKNRPKLEKLKIKETK